MTGICSNCGKELTITQLQKWRYAMKNGTTHGPFCSRKCFALALVPRASRIPGSTIVRNGYIHLKDKTTGKIVYRKEHRVVAERALGYLHPKAHVHHLNMNKRDKRK